MLENNIYSCTFQTEVDVNALLHGGPWSIRGVHVVLKRWSSSATLEEIKFDTSDFWVQVHNLPPDKMNQANMHTIGNFLGTPIAFPSNSNSHPRYAKFIRIRTRVDITKPLKTGFFMHREHQSTLWIPFKYE